MGIRNAEKRAEKARTKVEEMRRLHAEAQAAQAAAADALRECQEQLAEADDPIPELRALRTALAEADELVPLRAVAVARAEHAAEEAEEEAVEERQRQAVTAYRTATKHLAAALEQASDHSERLRQIRSQAPRPSDLPALHWRELQPEGGSRLVCWRSELLRFTNPPPPPKTETVSVRFLQSYHGQKALVLGAGYMAGEQAGFPPDKAKQLIDAGVAEPVSAER